VRKRTAGNIETVRMIDARQGAEYCGMGRDTFRKWAEQIGAVRKFGQLVRFDKKVIDAALDAEQQPTG